VDTEKLTGANTMRDPIIWKTKETEKTDLIERGPNAPKTRTAIIALACIVFLAICFALWLASGRSWLVLLILFVPCYACGEWLSSKIFSERSGLSISNSGFSIVRIIYGTIVAFLLLAGIYGIGWILFRWLD
jgi:hypothetical protein